MATCINFVELSGNVRSVAASADYSWFCFNRKYLDTLCTSRANRYACARPFSRRFQSTDSLLETKRSSVAQVNGISPLERWQTSAAPIEAAETGVESKDVFSKPSNADDASPSRIERQEKGQAGKGIYPGGLRRSEVRLPGLVITVRVTDVLGAGAKEFLEMVDSAIASGFTIVILDSGIEESSGGARLYEAARILKNLLRGRAELFVAERVDIAAAAGASGVLLSDEGLPAVIARSTMQNASAPNSVLPLVARSVGSAQSALSATAIEGADLLILQVPEDMDTRTVVRSVCQGVSIPIFVQSSASCLSSMSKADSSVLQTLQAGASGLVFNALDIKDVTANNVGPLVSSLVSAMNNSIRHRFAIGAGSTLSDEATGRSGALDGLLDVATAPMTLDTQFKKILEEERAFLTSLIELVQDASPEMEEVSLLADAVVQLDEPFLLVIVGEYNSGKSSVINALLGKRYLNEGVLPTTNEITLLKHAADNGDGMERSERHPDGQFIRYLSAELLKQMNLVDTPGTNVILLRQQRLTEEFVPRSDLVLFVLSADRPFTESEMTFLRYIRQWNKKIIFLLNKSDVYSDTKELEEVIKFIKDNAQQLLNVEQATVYPISARQALKAKTEVCGEDGIPDVERLIKSTSWKSSGFDKLESFIADFLGGSSDAGAERRRLKLGTPLAIASALLEACKRQLFLEAEKAESDLDILEGLLRQLGQFQKAMENDATLQRQRIIALIDATKDRADNFVDSILRLSNIDAVAQYLLGGDRKGTMPVSSSFDKQVLGSANHDVRRSLEEYQSWLKESIDRQVRSYKDLVTNRWPVLKNSGLRCEEESFQSSSGIEKQDSIAVLNGFDTQAAKIVLEQEFREVVFTTFGGLGAAGLSASVLTSVLPNTWEDLIALGVCSAGGLLGVWNLPNRRAEVKKKVRKVAESVAGQIGSAMKIELEDSVERLEAEIRSVVMPYKEAAQREADRVKRLQERVQRTESEVQRLGLKVQNLGIISSSSSSSSS